MELKPNFILEIQFIDLSLDKEKIFQNMKYNHRSEIKKIEKNSDIKITIINKKNYKKLDIKKMMEMHIFVSKKETRSEETWNIMEKMILNDKGFLTKVDYCGNTISYSFFAHNKYECNYFSSVTVRENFKIGGINHLSLWESIKYCKDYLQIKKFNLGITNYIFSRDNNFVDKKINNIAFFKSRFCGNKEINIILNNHIIT